MDLDLLKLDQENSILKLSNYETFLKESIQLYSKLENYFDESRFNKTNDTINYIYLSNMVNEYVLIELKNLVKCTNSDSISNIINSDINIEMKKNFKFTNGINNTPLELLYIKHVDDVNNLIYSFCFNDYLFYSIYKEDITIYWDITLDGRKSTIQQKSCNCAILPMGSFYKINPSNDCMLLKLNVLSLKSIYNYYKIDKSNILANDYLPSIEKLCVYQFIKLMKH
ncbi:hypothetical protein A3Q56_07215 [Intoshia linei]|uniref:Uncharacterized protein n=1 Tax=Intoshia linei TaxID=1819745 RepID=A0A177ASU9_9BILA|nr:hypothetical protein A3Q56_07215 [Intoshia linei]